MSEQNKKRVINIILIAILIIIFIWVVNTFKKKNFNDFVKAELYSYQSQFSRDDKVKYSKMYSYKIQSDNFNDAMLYKNVKVEPNKTYKVSCMVKTENVVTEQEISEGGAHISIADTVEKSKSIVGTEDWQKLEFKFNSKNRTSVDIGFRLGGYDENCTGTAWFSDFKIEEGNVDNDTNWKFVCFIIKNFKINLKENDTVREYKIEMTDDDVNSMKENMKRFQKSCNELSGNRMSAEYEVIEISEPLTSLSYDEENGYYVAPKNVYGLIDNYLQSKEYDHIFICIKFGDDINRNVIKVNDWIGLRRNGL